LQFDVPPIGLCAFMILNASCVHMKVPLHGADGQIQSVDTGRH
jgi:hypothetical protein